MPKSSVNRTALTVLAAIALVLLVAGWWLFWFLCDDAFIAFRYVHNFVNGQGLVWNPAPFGPVEGYTSFLWVVLLAAVWSATGIEPPQSANWLLLFFGIGSLVLILRMALVMRLSARLEPWRLWLLGLVLFGTLSNRTFLAWTSSGLEQGMFTCLLLAWVYAGCFAEPGRRQWLALGWLAALLVLARPDGLLFLALTAVMIVVVRVEIDRGVEIDHGVGLGKRDAWLLLPFALPALHGLWRRSTYGEWLPNTYYAKHVSPWPEAGLRYVASFALEYAYFLWLPLLGWAAFRALLLNSSRDSQPDRRVGMQRVFQALVLLALFGHFAYYTFRVGGDHFEYRIYHHLVPLLMLLGVWIVDRCEFRPAAALATIASITSLGLVLPWTHWAATHDLKELHEQGLPFVAIAPRFPEPIRAWPEQFDSLQRWLLTPRSIGLRHRTHVLFLAQTQERNFPDRSLGPGLDFGDELPVMFRRAGGYPGWTMPQLMIIDGLGLNDAIIARNPVTSDLRRMAHDRSPPLGYVECFEPNVRVWEGRVTIDPRREALTPARVRECEQRFREQVDDLRRREP